MRTSKLAHLAILLPMSLAGLLGPLPAEAGPNIYCCQDTSGKKACGDILPASCVGRAYRVLGPGGRIIKEVDAPLTPEQQAQRTAEEERRKEAEAAAKEKRRLDEALLQTYGSAADIDIARQRAEADNLATIKSAEAKIAEAKKQRKKLDQEAEFYRKKTLPPELAKSLKENEAEIQAQQSLIDQRTREVDAIRTRYDDDKRRYIELRQQRPRMQ